MTTLKFDPYEPILQDFIQDEYYVLNGTDLFPKEGIDTSRKVSWDGTVIKQGKWIDTKLFKLGNYNVTYKEVAIGSGVVAFIVILCIMACCYVSYKKRETLEKVLPEPIVDVVRRMSSVVMNTGVGRRLSQRANSLKEKKQTSELAEAKAPRSKTLKNPAGLELSDMKMIDDEERKTGKFGGKGAISEKEIELSFDRDNNPYTKVNNFFNSYMDRRMSLKKDEE